MQSQLDATSDGTKTVWGPWRDPFGNWSVPVSHTIVLDRPPVITRLPVPSLPSGGSITNSAGRVTLSWMASDLTAIES